MEAIVDFAGAISRVDKLHPGFKDNFISYFTKQLPGDIKNIINPDHKPLNTLETKILNMAKTRNSNGKAKRPRVVTRTVTRSVKPYAKPPRNSNNRAKGVLRVPKTQVATAPTAVGNNLGSSYIRKLPGRVQKTADYDSSDGSLRVEFSDLLGTLVKAGSTTASAGFGGTATYLVGLSPAAISPRLEQFEEIFEFYAFRKFRVEYIPLSGSTTAVGVNMGITNNIDSSSDWGIPTAQQMLELRPSMATMAWQNSAMEYSHTGTRLWATSRTGTASPDASEYQQGAILCSLDGSPVAGTTYGKVRITGIVDFYKEEPVDTTSPPFLLRKILRRIPPHIKNKFHNLCHEFIKKLELDISAESKHEIDEYKSFLEWKRDYQPLSNTPIHQEDKEEDSNSIATTITDESGFVKLNPEANVFKPGAEKHVIKEHFPSSDSFISSIVEMAINRRKG